MRHLDLFAGIGGFSLAAQWMGWETVAQVEWDKWCQKVLAKNFPDALRFGDIVEFNKMLQDGKIITDSCYIRQHTRGPEQSLQGFGEYGETLSGNVERRIDFGRIDIITGGFPCQPFSHAGKRQGVDDSRYLWPEMLTTIRIFKPTFVVGENVAGLVSMGNGKTLERILSDLENEGYQTESFIIPACAIGAWHRRDRIWIVAHNECKSNECITNSRINTKVNGKQREKTGEFNGSGNTSNVSNTESKRLERSDNTGDKEERRSSLRGNITGPNIKTISDSISQRGCSRDTRGEYAEDVRQQSGSAEHGYWNLEPSVGRMAYGLPSGMDGYWDREPAGTPRVATGVKNRVDRLKGLGNAIVPQVVFEVFKAIENVEKYYL